ncbi:MAG: ABC transporter ATP-binding protein [Spirochaetales bacterium]
MAGPMRGGPPGSEKTMKAKNFKASFKRLLKEMSIIKWQTIVVLILTVASVVLAIVTPKITEKAITELFKPLMGLSVDLSFVARVLINAGLLYLLSTIFNVISKYIMGGASQKIVYNMRKKVRTKIDSVPLKFYDTNSTGDLISRVTNDLDNIGSSLNQTITQVISSILTVIGVVIMMFSINFWLTIISLVTLPLSVFLAGFVMKHSQKQFAMQAKNLGALSGQVEETFSAEQIVKAFNKEEDELARFKKINEDLAISAKKANFFSGLIFPLITFVNNFGYVAISIVACIFIANGDLNPGYLMVFLQYSQQLTQPIAQMAQLTNTLQTLMASSERIFEVLDAEEEVKDDATSTVLSSVSGQVDFEGVKFGYAPNKILMNDINLHTKTGQTIAIVGPTGAGKTTIVNLIMRFYELNGGKIKIDNKDITSLTRASLRQNIGMVLQDTWLFNGTIKDNIAYGKKDATMEEIIAASELAQAHHFIETLPDGYNTIINEEASNISEGQKQLLTIARVILSSPKILILDEATSSVDTRTEIQLQKGINNLMKDRTSFVIAHRLSTIKDADNILVMQHGDIVEQGNHEELLNKKGAYFELYNSQFA